jgi:hypothetical protein
MIREGRFAVARGKVSVSHHRRFLLSGVQIPSSHQFRVLANFTCSDCVSTCQRQKVDLPIIFVRLRLILSIFAQTALISRLTKRGVPRKNNGLDQLAAVA